MCRSGHVGRYAKAQPVGHTKVWPSECSFYTIKEVEDETIVSQ
jgi:hypothetical protein